jgi:hypothetical protein
MNLGWLESVVEMEVKFWNAYFGAVVMADVLKLYLRDGMSEVDEASSEQASGLQVDNEITLKMQYQGGQ